MKFYLITTVILILFVHLTLAQALKSDGKLKQINGTELYVKTLGTGEPIVIVHGGPGMDHSYFLPQFNELAKYYKLIFYDQRASGLSSANVDTNSITMKNFVKDLEGIRKYFGIEKMNLLGHSWGGLVAMFYTIKYPENLKSLILSNPTPPTSDLRNASFKLMAERTSREDSIAQTKLIHSKRFAERDPKTMENFFRLLFASSFYHKSYIDSLTLRFPDDYSIKSKLINYLYKDTSIMNYDITDKLEKINCPVLIVTGDYDLMPQESNNILQKNIKNSKLVILKNCGHFPFVEDKNEYFILLENFLSKVE